MQTNLNFEDKNVASTSKIVKWKFCIFKVVKMKICLQIQIHRLKINLDGSSIMNNPQVKPISFRPKFFILAFKNLFH